MSSLGAETVKLLISTAVMELMRQGHFSADRLVTKRIDIDDIVSEGFEALAREKSQIKILVKAPD